GVIIPEGFDDALIAGEGGHIDLIEGEGSGLETDILISVIDGVTAQLTAATVTATAGAQAGLAPEQVAGVGEQVGAATPPVTAVAGQTATEQLSGSGMMVAGQAGLFLLFTVGFGVISLIREREQGTLMRLRSMPMRPGLIVTAKAASAYLIG